MKKEKIGLYPDPDPTPDPAIFVCDLQQLKKSLF